MDFNELHPATQVALIAVGGAAMLLGLWYYLFHSDG
jgi:hypothetical protein